MSCEKHYHSVRKISEKKQPGLSVGEVVIVHDEHLPRGLWKLGRIQETIEGRDGQIRGATIKMAKRDKQQDLLRRPIQLLYLLELCCPNPPEIGTEGPAESPENVSPPGIGSTEGDENTENLHSESRKRFEDALDAPPHDEQMNAGRPVCINSRTFKLCHLLHLNFVIYFILVCCELISSLLIVTVFVSHDEGKRFELARVSLERRRDGSVRIERIIRAIVARITG